MMRELFCRHCLLVVPLWFLSALVMLNACSSQQEQKVVAVVGSQQITDGQLRKFVLTLPPGLRSGQEGQEREDYLQTLIDRELMLMEARRRGLDKNPELLEKMRNQKNNYILTRYRRREILPKIEISEEELDHYLVENDMDQERLLETILVETEEEALQLLQLLAEGQDFAELSNQYSLDDRSARQGGMLSFVDRPTAERLGIFSELFHSLQDGEVSPPLPHNNNYHLIRFVADRPTGIEGRQHVHQQLRREAQWMLEAQKTEMLAYQLGWRMAPEGWKVLQRQAQSTEAALQLSREEEKTPLFVYDGGHVRIRDYVEVLRSRKIKSREALTDSAFIVAIAKRSLLPDAMLLKAAEELSIPREPDLRRRLEDFHEELLLETMREQVLDQIPEITEEEMREFYADHPQFYHLPETICFQEIVLRNEAQAKRLKAELNDDSDLSAVARERRYHTRARGAEGVFCMGAHEKQASPTMWNALQQAPLGVVSGPVLFREGTGMYALFKVVRREEPRPEPFAQARNRVRSSLVRRAEREFFDAWLIDLRRQYQDQIEIFTDRLPEALPDVLLASG